MADEFYDPKPWERPLAKPLSLPVSNTGEWQPIETAPHACHFLATYWSDDFCEWTVSVVMQPLSGPWTHWQPLPEAPNACLRY